MPIDFLGATPDQVSHVRAVVPFAFLDKSFHPDHLFRGHYLYTHTENFLVVGARKPRIVYFRQPIAGGENQVRKIVAEINFSLPMGEGFFSSIARFATNL